MVHLSFACGDYDRVAALRDGRVRAEGIDLTFLPLGPEEIFFRQAVHREFDVSEMSLGSYVLGRSRDDLSLVAIPIFPSRVFRHSAIFINTEAGVEKPEDLRGKQVGVAEYQLTANVWARGILQEEHGVHPRDIIWRTGGLEEPGRREKLKLPLPSDIRISPIDERETLSGMLERGDIAAVITPRNPSSFARGSARVRRLFPDYRAVETEYYRRTGIFPLMHTVAIRREVYEANRWIAQSLVKALTEAKRLAIAKLHETAALPVMLPWMQDDVEQVRTLVGEDWWPSGLEPNRLALETFLRYAHEQGIAPKRLVPEDLFAKETLDTFRI